MRSCNMSSVQWLNQGSYDRVHFGDGSSFIMVSAYHFACIAVDMREKLRTKSDSNGD